MNAGDVLTQNISPKIVISVNYLTESEMVYQVVTSNKSGLNMMCVKVE